MNRLATSATSLRYPDVIESAVSEISVLLPDSVASSKRSVALLILQRDKALAEYAEEKAIEDVILRTERRFAGPLSLVISRARLAKVQDICGDVVSKSEPDRLSFKERLSRAMMRPLTGIPILAIVLYFGFYQLVGVFGAGTVVDFVESTIFGTYINPGLISLVNRLIPFPAIQALFVGEYGVITLGLSYAFAIVLPIVTLFFLVFSVIEDSGYLPRLAMLIDRVFKAIGLNGRAVIPMVLGFGCDTMATIVTRTQETKRERILTTILLALAIPCSAQLGVVMGMLSVQPLALVIWVVCISGVFLIVGFIGGKVLPGESARFYMELPPLRLPRIKNVLLKTFARLKWYLVEVIPIFILASVLLWAGEMTGVFELIISRIMAPLVELIGLPTESAVAFFFGFFRRDFGAAGLYDLHSAGILNGIPLVVAAVTLTLFLPCVAQFAVMIKERGIKVSIGITLFVLPFSFGFGFLLNKILLFLRVPL